jgi:GTP cyclohydrolase FolE2
MKRLLLMTLPVLSFIFSSCGGGTADGKVPELASEMCQCYESMQQSLTPAAMQLYKDVAKASDPSVAFQAGLAKLNRAETDTVARGLMRVTSASSPVYQCLKAYDKKHEKETTRDKNALLRKLLVELQKNTACPLSAAIVNLGIKRQEQLGTK